MHLKLDRLITKNTNGIEIQIYSCLIAYVLLKLVKIPQEFGEKTLDKFRYLQAFMCENISKEYEAPPNGRPVDRRVTGSRPGCPDLEKIFTALVPADHVGEAVSERPTF